MKKIFIIALCFFFITSCSNNEIIESEEVQPTEIENNQSDKNVEITTPEKKDPVEKIENNIISVEVMDFAEKREELFEMSKAELNNF
jgi:PBP1b-binding outer membrane lipoprotein LpoB